MTDTPLAALQAELTAELSEALPRPETTLDAPTRALLGDGSGGVAALRRRLWAHAAEARVAERLLRQAGHRGRLDGAGDVAAPLWSALAAGLRRRLTRRIDRALSGLAPDAVTPTTVDARLFPSAFPERATKRRGAVYTDPELVELVLDLAGWEGHGRLLEPAAGAGAFALAARARAADEATLAARDVHPFACRAARVALALQALTAAGPAVEVERRDALAEPAAARWDVVVGNPPWVRGERIPAAQRAAYRARFPDLGRGNVDLCAYVVRQALDALVPGGRLAFVIPQGLLEARSTAGLRRLLAEHTVEAVVSLEWAEGLFPGANAIPAVLVVRRGAPAPDHAVRVGVAALGPFRREAIRWSRVPQRDWLALGRQDRWPLLLRAADLAFLRRLDAAPRPLRGGYGLAIRTRVGAQALIADDPQVLTAPRPLLDGREVRAWSLDWSGRWLDYRPEAISDPKTEAFFAAPKVLLPRIALTTQAAVDDDRGFVARNTVMVVRAPGTALAAHPHALAALVNALPTRVYAYLLLRAGALAGSHRCTFYAGVVGDLPVPASLLAPGPALTALDDLGRRAHAAAATGCAATLASLEQQVDQAVAAAHGLSPADLAALQARAAEPPLRDVLNPRRPGTQTRAIGAQAYAVGQRYR